MCLLYPDDDKFIACALGAECFLIVSGDKDLLDITGYAGIDKPLHLKMRTMTRFASSLAIGIVKPGEFLKRYLPKE